MIKHLAEKSFSVFNSMPPNTIEHTKTFFGKFFNIVLLRYMKNVFFIISRFFLQNFVGLVNKGGVVQKGISISLLQKSFS
jgi:hypothetical protein